MGRAVCLRGTCILGGQRKGSLVVDHPHEVNTSMVSPSRQRKKRNLALLRRVQKKHEHINVGTRTHAFSFAISKVFLDAVQEPRVHKVIGMSSHGRSSA